jgi:exodeoxyribonuclease VII small subunit
MSARKTTTAEPASAEPTQTYTQKLQQLTDWVHQLEGGKLGFEESVERFEAAMRLSGELQQYLQTAEQRVTQALRTAEGAVQED